VYTQIKVRYIDGHEDMIDSPKLEELIDSGEISHFRRSDGWVDVIGAKTRVTFRETFSVKERRRDFLARQAVFGATGSKSSRHVAMPGIGRMTQFLAVISRTIANFLW
jgi:hypothetical protein